MRSRERSSRENRRFSCLEKVPEDFFQGQIGVGRLGERPTPGTTGTPRSRIAERSAWIAGFRISCRRSLLATTMALTTPDDITRSDAQRTIASRRREAPVSVRRRHGRPLEA